METIFLVIFKVDGKEFLVRAESLEKAVTKTMELNRTGNPDQEFLKAVGIPSNYAVRGISFDDLSSLFSRYAIGSTKQGDVIVFED